ncbi:unnamed protein product [Ceratitis capitata]|uniref:(Mediterranean fruit fly) hypothetical protein n=1 Tax=Ceratitis capitata TaxID=7213 RepID=A0A811U3H1_CERCA|nr:unnamed protein product [Ceratitis capitata]
MYISYNSCWWQNQHSRAVKMHFRERVKRNAKKKSFIFFFINHRWAIVRSDSEAIIHRPLTAPSAMMDRCLSVAAAVGRWVPTNSSSSNNLVAKTDKKQ